MADEAASFGPAGLADSAPDEVVESSRNRILGCRGKGLLWEVQAAVAGDQRAAARSLIVLLLNHCFSAAAARRFVTNTVGRFGHCDFRSTAARGTLVDFTFLQSHCLCPPLSLRIPKERQVSPGRLGCRASLPTLVLIELRSFPAILAPTHRQVNAQPLLQQVHAVEERVEAGGRALLPPLPANGLSSHLKLGPAKYGSRYFCTPSNWTFALLSLVGSLRKVSLAQARENWLPPSLRRKTHVAASPCTLVHARCSGRHSACVAEGGESGSLRLPKHRCNGHTA